MIRVTRRYRFSASHRLHSPRLAAEEAAAESPPPVHEEAAVPEWG